MRTIRLALADAAERLSAAGVADPAREAAWLLAHLRQTRVGSLLAQAWEPISPDVSDALAHLVERRANREPIQYILGTEEFMGMTFRVSPAVLIPRLDTEVLVHQARVRLSGRAHIADIGTGSGAIAVAMAALFPDATVVAVDISDQALSVARANAIDHAVADRVAFRQGDLLAPIAGEQFDAILSNPPYISEGDLGDLMPEVSNWEPHLALSPGPDGLLMYRRLAADAPALLKPGGFLAVEVGIGQAQPVKAIFEQAGLAVVVYADTGEIERVVIGSRP